MCNQEFRLTVVSVGMSAEGVLFANSAVKRNSVSFFDLLVVIILLQPCYGRFVKQHTLSQVFADAANMY